MKTISRYIMTLALLLTAVTGAWAQDKYTVQFKANGNTKTVENITLPHTFGCTWNDELGRGTGELDVIIQELYGLSGGTCASVFPESDNASVTSGVDDGDNQYIIVNAPFNGTATVTGVYFNSSLDQFNYSLEITCVDPNADPNAITVKWDPATKTGTFTMPAFDVEIAPIYAPVAQWAKVENEDQLPTAAEGIFAESTDSIITPGKVAKIGETENPQGEVMYFATGDKNMTAAQAMAADGWLSKLPTAAGYERDTTIYVWYYIKGADTPQGQTATAENTFNDSEICAEPIEVKILSNKFDIQFKAANANTIEAGKATVKVGEKAAEVKEGKLTGVKMDSKVTVTAKDGYKFRKVEVKKGGGEPVLLTTITAADNSSFKSGSQTFGDVATVTLTGNGLTNDGSHGGWYCLGSNLTATISVAAANGANITSVKFYTAGGGSAEDKDAPFEVTTTSMSSSNITTYLNGNAIGSYGVSKIEVYGTK